MAPRMSCPRERILASSVDVGGCWIWRGPTTRDGYGVLSIRRKQFRAHRIAFEVFTGEQADGLLVCHACDTPLCVNPDHLFLGAPCDNTRDMIQKGRRADLVDAAHGNTKVSHADRRVIIARRADGETLKSIAADYGVTFQTISAICRGARSYAATL